MMPPALVVSGLCKRHGVFSLRDVGLRVEPGSIVGLVGQNGAGKSTTLRLIMGLERKLAGSVSFGRWDHLADEKVFKTEVAYVDEESFFYAHLSVAALLRFVAGFFSSWDQARAEELLDRLQLDPEASAGNLSKGNRTKLALVSALARRPKVLLLDEPTAGLDPLSREELFLVLEECRAQRLGVLLSSHVLDELERVVDRVVILHDGQVLADEAVTALRQADPERGAGWLTRRFLSLVRPAVPSRRQAR
jgi:ABC-2 type transport system ATP-binding protein